MAPATWRTAGRLDMRARQAMSFGVASVMGALIRAAKSYAM